MSEVHIHRWQSVPDDWHECAVCGLACRDAQRAFYELALRDVASICHAESLLTGFVELKQQYMAETKRLLDHQAAALYADNRRMRERLTVAEARVKELEAGIS